MAKDGDCRCGFCYLVVDDDHVRDLSTADLDRSLEVLNVFADFVAAEDFVFPRPFLGPFWCNRGPCSAVDWNLVFQEGDGDGDHLHFRPCCPHLGPHLGSSNRRLEGQPSGSSYSANSRSKDCS